MGPEMGVGLGFVIINKYVHSSFRGVSNTGLLAIVLLLLHTILSALSEAFEVRTQTCSTLPPSGRDSA